MKELKFKFLKRSGPVFPVHIEIAEPKERRFLKVEVTFVDDTSGLGIIKL